MKFRAEKYGKSRELYRGLEQKRQMLKELKSYAAQVEERKKQEVRSQMAYRFT